jgi:hypothetical protein
MAKCLHPSYRVEVTITKHAIIRTKVCNKCGDPLGTSSEQR